MDRGNLGERVRTVRKTRDLSQEALAREAGVSLNLVNKLERGVVTDPHYSTLSGIARALGVSVQALVREPAPVGKAEALSTAGLLKEDSVLPLVYNAVRWQYEHDKEAADRALASEDIPQPAYFKHYENDLVPLLLELSPEEVVGLLIEDAYLRVESEAENARLKQENTRLKEDLTRKDEAERRTAFYEPWMEFANRYADRWEQKIAQGVIELGAANEFISTLEDLGPILRRLGLQEKQEQSPEYPHTYGPVIGEAITRLMRLLGPLGEAGHKQFENSELAQLRRELGSPEQEGRPASG